MSTRTDLQQIIDSNVYDNNNKEILASMMRTVLEALMNSDFNKDDDQLQNLKYDSTKTLAQQFALLPIIQEATIGPFNVGVGGSINVSGGVAVSCTGASGVGGTELSIIFPPSLDLLSKKVIITPYVENPTNARLNANRIFQPIYGFFSATEMRVLVNEINPVFQELYLKIYLI
jgi:hypothetical protein